MIGIYNQNELQLQEIVFYGLYALQHRGQESAGIAVTDGNSISYLEYGPGCGSVR